MDGAFSIGSIVAHIKADLSDFQAGIDKARVEGDGLGSKLSGIGDGIADIGQKAAIFATLVSGAFVVGSKEAVGYASDLQQTRVQLDAFTGSAEKGAKAMSILNDFAKTAPLLPLSDIMKAGPSLIAFGLVNDSLSDLNSRLNEVGSLAVASHQPVQTAIDLFAHAKEGILRLQELGEFGISRDELAKFGVEFTQTGEAVDRSKLLPALEKLVDTKFGTLFAKEQGTFGGAVQNIKDDLMRLGAGIVGVDAATGDPTKGSIFEKLQAGANAFYGWLDANMGTIQNFVNSGVKQVGDVFNTIWKAIQPLVNWIKANPNLMVDFLKGLAIGFGALLIIGTIAGMIALLTNPLTLIVIAVALLATAWQTNFLGIRDITQHVITEVVNFFQNYLMPFITLFVNYWKADWNNIKLTFEGIWNLIIGIIRTAWDIVYGIIKVGIDLLTGNWSQAWKDIQATLSGAWDGIKQIMLGGVQLLEGIGGSILHALTKPFEDAWNKISDLMNKIKSALDFTQRHSPSVIDVIENGVSLANQAFSKLNVNIGIPGQIANNVSGNLAYAGGGMGNIYIDMTGAVISDTTSASNIGETIGDAIIDKLKQNIRF